MDPNEKPNNEQNPDAAAAAAAVEGDGTQQAGADPAQVTESETAAFDKGVESVKATELPAPVEGTDESAAAAAAGTEGGDGKDGAGKTDGQGATAPGAAKPNGQPDPKQAVEAEMKELGITNERSQKRFRELSERAAEVEPLRARAAMADEWETTALSTGANPEQFGAALGYLRAVNSGDPAMLRMAYDQIMGEAKTLGEMLGLAAPGVDPLDAHPDLKEQVIKGDLDRKIAEELVTRRAAEKLTTATTTHRNTQDQQQRAQQEGTQAVAALGARLRATDPHFTAKFESIGALVNTIQRTLPPAQWAPAIEELWKTVPTPAAAAPAAPAKPTPSTQPLRPTGSSAGQLRKPQNAEEAFSFGVDVARAHGQ